MKMNAVDIDSCLVKSYNGKSITPEVVNFETNNVKNIV